jgi:hypothetical protein
MRYMRFIKQFSMEDFTIKLSPPWDPGARMARMALGRARYPSGELTLHDVQFQLCEFDKYERAKHNEGFVRRYVPCDHCAWW